MSPDLRYLAGVRPSARQRRWQELEFYGFVHFGMNTVTDREWGLGHEDPALFDPAHVDADGWVATMAAAGMRVPAARGAAPCGVMAEASWRRRRP